jgi:hypothetical protein
VLTIGKEGDESMEQLLREIADFSSPGEHCFLCGKSLLSGDYTQEHIIPRWAQQRYDLWNQQIVLVNRTCIPYRNLTVPCCAECNKYRLKPIEDSISQTVDLGKRAVAQLGEMTIFLWLGKLLYGLLYKELTLLLNRADPKAGTIITPEVIERYRDHRFFLQQVRQIVECVDFCPGSIHLFSMQKMPQPVLEWDFCDNVDTMFIGCRAGRTAFIASLGDGGAEQAMAPLFAGIADVDLHPIQFREICATVCYRSTLRTRIPKHITVQGQPHKVHQMPLGGFSLKPYFEEWDIDTYAKYLAFYLGVEVKHVRLPSGEVKTWLYDGKWNPRFIDFSEYPGLPGNIID